MILVCLFLGIFGCKVLELVIGIIIMKIVNIKYIIDMSFFCRWVYYDDLLVCVYFFYEFIIYICNELLNFSKNNLDLVYFE